MALIYDGKTFRNLEEQVRKNKQDISNLEKIQTLLNEFGIHVIGKVDDETQLPASSSAFGNAYAVGIQAPYEYYIWTDLQPTPGWLNIGIFPAPSNVQGPQGKEGTSVTAASVVDGYLVLTLTDADGNDTQITAGYVKGAQGVQGPRGLQGLQGIQGEQGIQGLTGPQGPRGYTGWALDIISVLTDPAKLPDPDTGDRHDAYVINDGGDDYEIYGKVEDGDGFAWHSFGLIAFSTNYVTAAQLASAIGTLQVEFVNDVSVTNNLVDFKNTIGEDTIFELSFAKINGQNIVGVSTNFQLTTKTELSSFQSALILGTFEVAIAKEAKAIKALSDESGETQTEPFIIQGTGTANNTVKVDTSKVAELKAKAISTVEVNQLAKEINTTNYRVASGSASITTGKITLTGMSVVDETAGKRFNFISGHKYLIRFHANSTLVGAADCIIYNGSDNTITINSGSNEYYYISTAVTTQYDTINFRVNSYTSGQIEITKFCVIDLTQWFGSNDKIPQGLLGHPENFIYYYTGSLAYNAGTQKSSNGVYLCSGGRNIWDEEWEEGSISESGVNSPSSIQIRSKNYISVIPRTQIYFYIGSNRIGRLVWFDKNKNVVEATYPYGNEVINVPNNVYFMRFVIGNGDMPINTYNNDITISLYYATGEGYDKHYPYVESNKYNLSGALPPVIEIEDYGTMWWEDENNELIEIAQGLTVFYPADYVGFIDSLSKHLNGNASSVSTLPMLPGSSSDGTYVLKATKTGSTITYTWVLES